MQATTGAPQQLIVPLIPKHDFPDQYGRKAYLVHAGALTIGRIFEKEMSGTAVKWHWGLSICRRSVASSILGWSTAATPPWPNCGKLGSVAYGS